MPGSSWWNNGRKRNIPPPVPDTLITNGLYASLPFNEGSGSITAAENNAGIIFDLLGDETGTPIWRPGGGITFPGGSNQLRRLSESAMDLTDGVTLTVAFKPNSPGGLGRLIQRQSSTGGYVLQPNPSGKPVQLSTRNGSSTTTSKVVTYVDQAVQVLCVSCRLSDGLLRVNYNGNVVTAVPGKTAAWVNGVTNLLIGFTFVGDLYYVSKHLRFMTDLECAQNVKYAQKLQRPRGLIA